MTLGCIKQKMAADGHRRLEIEIEIELLGISIRQPGLRRLATGKWHLGSDELACSHADVLGVLNPPPDCGGRSRCSPPKAHAKLACEPYVIVMPTFLGAVDGRPAMPGLRVGHVGRCKNNAPVLGLNWPILQGPQAVK